MLKRTLTLFLLCTLLISSTAVAEVTNRDMQLMGGVTVSNSQDSFFFAPMEEGVTKHWGLYAVSKVDSGPVAQMQNAYPARLVHADLQNVYFFSYKDDTRTTHALYSISLESSTSEMLLDDIGAAFVAKDNEFMYVTTEDPYTLCSYNIPDRKSSKIKDMSNSEKTIYDAVESDGKIYFLTLNKSGQEDGYLLNASSGKANNLDKPSPAPVTSLLYEDYRIYASDRSGTQVYAQKLGTKSSSRLGEGLSVATLTNPRFGDAMFAYDGEANQMVRVPLDGSAMQRLSLEGSTIKRLILGGSKDELFIAANDGIYALTPDLSSQTRLFDFNLGYGGQVWSYIAPAGDNILIMGYGAETYTHANSMMPTGVFLYSRSGELLFSYPEFDAEAASAEIEAAAGVPVTPTIPESGIGDVPREDNGEEETIFIF